MKKEKIYLILTTIFVILTLALTGYILAKEGTVNAGYSLIPCLFAVIFSNLCIKERNKNKKVNKKQLEKHNKRIKIIIVIIIIFIILNLISMISIGNSKENNNNLIEITPKITDKKEITKSVMVDKTDYSYTIYYYGIKDAKINLNNEKLDLADSLAEGKITIDKIIDDLKKHDELNDGGTEIYKDGGTKKYLTDNYTIIKCNTLNGNKDIYIGDKDMEYEKGFCK